VDASRAAVQTDVAARSSRPNGCSKNILAPASQMQTLLASPSQVRSPIGTSAGQNCPSSPSMEV